MKKTVLTYGLISGVIGAVLMLAHVPFMDGGSKGLIVGYTGIVLSALLIFFGVRSYRENVGPSYDFCCRNGASPASEPPVARA